MTQGNSQPAGRNTKSVGDGGEEKAARFLQGAGYEILRRQWRTRRGEVDIIAKKGDLVVFAEVKTMPRGCYDTLERLLDTRKQKRIIETAKFFLADFRQYNECFIRFDVLIVDMHGTDSVRHIENAFSELV
ncbi:MAG: YraN family protein [Spirochaetaceae bacterium]|jgi:putative endonuclease|nr:YraN family protein [Spirochaetaceae bacterium]